VTDPRLIVEVRWGKMAGTKAAIEPGKTLRVGRTELADLVLTHDGQLSGAHFELGWDGAMCALRDLGSLSGTKLGGETVAEAKAPHGAWIQAGETDFIVYVEGKTPPPERDLTDADRAREEARLEAAHHALVALRKVAASEPLYAVVDSARDDRILQLVREHVEAHQSLYDGFKGEMLEDLAPYLVGPMQEGSALLERLITEGWGKRWGIWCTSREKFVEVRRHWRRFLMVDLEESGERVYFRFYDPGVLRVFWGTCNAAQRDDLSHSLSSILVEQKDLSLTSLPRALEGERHA
jgi:hypothetical protein